MHDIFKRWAGDLIPVDIKPDPEKEGKKKTKPMPWKDGQSYSKFSMNSIALRTGTHTANVIDVDTKDIELLENPFKEWVYDRLAFGDTLTVETANGYHFYFKGDLFELQSTAKTGANRSEIPYIDFRGVGGLAFIYSESEIAWYEVMYDAEPTEDIEELLPFLPPYVDRTENIADEEGFINLDDETDKGVTVANDKGDTPLEQIQALLDLVSSDCVNDDWIAYMASAYNMTSDKKAIKKILYDWSKKSDRFTEDGFTRAWSEVSTGRYGKGHKGGTLVKEARDRKPKTIIEKLNKAETLDEMKEIFKDGGEWQSYPQPREESFDEVAKAYKKKGTELQGSNMPIATAREAVHFEKPMSEEEKQRIEDSAIYICGTQYYIRTGIKLSSGLSKSALKDTAKAVGFGLSDKTYEKLLGNIIAVKAVNRETKYNMVEAGRYQLKESSNVTELSSLNVYTNPYHNVPTEFNGRMDIVEDFFTNIWKGKAEDVLRIIGLTMRFEETKLNKIHVVAPSNAGKTSFLQNIGFQTIHMDRLLEALRAGKGIGKVIMDKVKESGFLLLDEVNKPLTEDIKNIDNYMYIDQFQEGGTQAIKLQFTCMTSTHKTAVRGMSDEMYNRLLLVELTDMGYPLSKSELFMHENEAYTKTLTDYGKWVVKDALTNPKYTKRDLLDLQNKYRLELNNDVDEMLTEISEGIISEYKALAKEDGNIVVRNDEYFIKRKTDLITAIEDRMSEYSHIDKGKYSDKLVAHFLGDATTKSIKVGGKPIKYYPMSMKKYYPSLDAEIIDEFEDLDEAEAWEE